jgi:hypothetical protein
MGLLLLAATAAQVWSYSQAPAGPTNLDFQDVARQGTAGTSFDDAASAFVRNLPAHFDYDIDAVTFTAVREEPMCDVRLKSWIPLVHPHVNARSKGWRASRANLGDAATLSVICASRTP